MNKLLLAMIPALLCGQTLSDAPRAELQNARTAGTEAAFQKAEDSAASLAAKEPGNPLATYYLGAVRMEFAGWYANHQQFDEANRLLKTACEAMDRAVAMQPGDFGVRIGRGMAYAQFPPFLNKAATAREDLEAAIANPRFAALPKEKQDAVRAALDRAAGAGGKPDRFPKVSAALSPILVAATVTMPDGGSVAHIINALKGMPGLLGTHVLRSDDKPGMFVVLTWWNNKAAVNDFFYGPVHRGFIEQSYGKDAQGGVRVTQVGVEVFTPLDAGVSIGGGLTPDSVSGKK